MRPVHPATLRFALALALTAVAGPVLAQGGPPLITDDPDTPGPHHWEINLSFFREQAPHEHLCETPRLDLNYGEGRRFQLRLETPHLLEREDGGGRRSGLGDTTAGVKWRFLGEEGQRLAWAVYAQFEFNTSQASVRNGLVEDSHALLFPTEITLEFHPVELNVEVGRSFVSHGLDGLGLWTRHRGDHHAAGRDVSRPRV